MKYLELLKENNEEYLAAKEAGIPLMPGIGNKAFAAMISADIPFIMGYNMFLALLSVLGVLLADLMYAWVDPRVKLK